MENFWDYNVWGFFNLIAVLLLSLLAATVLRKTVKGLNESLIPTSVLGGGVLLVISAFYKLFTGANMFDTNFFGGNGMSMLELITYHALALGFIASTFKTSDKKLTKERTVEIFNTGVTTVSTYLLQGSIGMALTIGASLIASKIFPASGILLALGYGQGTGQAMNYGNIYEVEFGFAGGKSFGLTIAAMGFLCASIGGVIHMTIMKRKGMLLSKSHDEGKLLEEEIQSGNEIPMQDSIDKITIQIALVTVAYLLAYIMMLILGNLMPGMKSVIYGFNFLLGVLSATLLKVGIRFFRNKGIMKKEYTNNFLMTRVSNFFFDIMVVAGIAAIRLGALLDYWFILLLLGLVGAAITFVYIRFVTGKLFRAYREEQFLAMYGMLTGTASTGVILLREIDGHFKTPAADNLVYQNFPAMVFGFPLMLLAAAAPKNPVVVMCVIFGMAIVMNVILFRSFIFRKLKIKA